MPDISFLEFAVYGFIAYSSVLMLILSVIREIPTSRQTSAIRASFLIPGLFAIGILMNSGPNILFETITTDTSNFDPLLVLTGTSQTTETHVITLQSQVWIIFHFMLFLVMIVYIILQFFFMLVKKD